VISVSDQPTVLSVRNLEVSFATSIGLVNAVRKVSFDVKKKEIFGLIGESGSGKSTTALAITRLLPAYAVVKGDVTFYDQGKPIDVLKLNEGQLRDYRWRHVSLVFQGAMNSLNPVLTVREHFKDTAKAHGIKDDKKIEAMARELLSSVRLNPDRVLNAYQHQLSGGMKQRVMIALALMLRPELVILDEPTTALDALTQRQILDLVKELRDKYEMSVILITHDLSVIADTADEVLVLYSGTPMEMGEINEIFYEPLSPYTQMLIDSFPMIGRVVKERPQMLKTASSVGCPFATNCPLATQACFGAEMSLKPIKGSHMSSCIHADQLVGKIRAYQEEGQRGGDQA